MNNSLYVIFGYMKISGFSITQQMQGIKNYLNKRASKASPKYLLLIIDLLNDVINSVEYIIPNYRMTSYHNRNHRHNLHGLDLRTVSAPMKSAGSFSSGGVLDLSSYGASSSLHAPWSPTLPPSFISRHVHTSFTDVCNHG
jgi:hypothetical protein